MTSPVSTGRSALLSQGAELLVRRAEAQVNAGTDMDCDVLIVGSGYGGAVAAARLAGQRIPIDGGGTRPASVWLIERGLEYLPGSFPDRFADLPGHVRFSRQDGTAARGRAEALFDVRVGGDASLLLGNGLGGGSLINAGVMARAAYGTLRAGWPTTLSPETLESGYAAALAMLQPQTLPADMAPAKLVSLQRLAGSGVQRCAVAVNHAVAHVTPAGVPMQPCTMCGDCVSGCNQGAKLTLDTNYLALAHRHSVQLFTGGTVERVVRADSEQGAHWRVDWHFTEPSRRPPDSGAFAIRAGKVVLAAGSLGSTEILMRSRSAALQVSSRLGSGFSTNGDNLVSGFQQTDAVHACASEQSDPADPRARGVGPTITGMAHVTVQGTEPKEQDDAGEGGDRVGVDDALTAARHIEDASAAGAFTVQEFAVPAALRRLFGEVVTTTFLLNGREPALPAPGEAAEDPLAVTDAAVDHTALYGLMGDDGAGGHLVYTGSAAGKGAPAAPFGDGQIRIDWPALSRLPLFDQQVAWLEKASGARGGPGGTVLPSPLWRPLGQAGATLAAGPPITVHPLGGCPMGETAATGVVDSLGQVFRPDGGIHAGLVVLDGSVVPRALAINPALTIAAIAEQACQGLLQQWGWTTGEDPLPAQASHHSRAHAARQVVSRPYADRRTGVELAEHFDGSLELAGQRYWIALRLRTQPIPDLASFVRCLPRQVRLRTATLELTPVDADHDEFSPAPHSAVVARFRLEGDIGLFEPVAAMPNREASKSRELRYSMKIAAGEPLLVAGTAAVRVLPAGTSITGLKSLQAGDEVSAWVRLTQLDVRIETQGDHAAVPIPAVWRLDLGRMARLRRLLLRLTHQANAPEAIADLVALVLLVARVLLVNQRLFEPDFTDMPHHLDERYPTALDGVSPEVLAVDGTGGARLSHYVPPGDAPPQGRPVLMIHGLGASGSTFAHSSIPGNLVRHTLGERRHVWVLDLNTSIGNESASDGGRHGRPMDFETVALSDIPSALRMVHAASGGAQIDVIAHCIGAAMFCVALLESARPADARSTRAEASALRALVGAVVLSQVGPLVRLSPLNQFRGFVASYVQQFLGTAEFDTRPDYQLERNPRSGKEEWKQAKAGLALTLLDWILTQFPYPPDDGEDARVDQSGVAFRRVRHRADAIFGQLMELRNVADETLAALDAIYGWVKVSTLAQTIHYARHRMLTNASGQNASLVRQFFDSAFGFPVLLLHGQRNRVFDWRGSLESFELLAALRSATPAPQGSSRGASVGGEGGVWRDGEGLELRIVPGYGHQDCIIGANAHRDVFPGMFAFLDKQAASHLELVAGSSPVTITGEVPWIGPVMGWLRRDEGEQAYVLSVLVHAQPRHARTLGIAVVPMRLENGAWEPIMSLARGFLADDLALTQPASGASISDSAALLSPPSDLLLQHCMVLRLVRHGVLLQRLAVITLHSDLPVALEALLRERSTGVGIAEEWLMDSRPLGDLAVPAVAAFFEVRDPEDRRVEAAMLTLSPNVFAAADAGPGEARPPIAGQAPTGALCFALGSCQYPPGLLDTDVAESSYRQLLAVLEERCEPFTTGWTAGPAPCPQFLVLGGDQVYVDATAGAFDPAPSNDRDTVAKAYELNWQLPAFRAVAARLPVYTLLDDHEVHDNWQPATRAKPADSPHPAPEDDQVTAALKAYATYQARIQPTPRGPRSRSYGFWPGGFPLYALDTRSERELRRVAGRGEGQALEAATLVSQDSMSHLQRWLKAQPEDLPKFVLCPSPILPLEPFDPERHAERLRSDGWSGYPASLWSLLEFIRDNDVQRVIFLSGDVHCSLATKLVLNDGRNAIYSVVSSGLFAPWPFANARAADFVLEGDVVAFGGEGPAFGRMVTAPVPPPGGLAIVCVSRSATGAMTLGVEFINAEGARHRYQIDLDVPSATWQPD